MGEKRGMSFEEIQEGDRLPECRVRMDTDTYFDYNKLVKNINPLHSDKDYAIRLGFKDIVVAGVYTFSFIPRMIEEWLGEPGRITGVEIKYQAPVYIGDTIVHQARVSRKLSEGGGKYIECEVSVEDLEGRLLTRATVTIDLS